MRTAWILVLVAAAASLAACRSSQSALPSTVKPYKVVLLPVEGAEAALAEKNAVDDVALALTPAQLETKIADGIRDSHVFSEVVLADAAALKGKGDQDEMQLASALARRDDADLILRVEVKSARMTDKGPNTQTVWSTLTWFMIPLPIWFVKDREYDADVAILAELYDPTDSVRPRLTVPVRAGRQDLNLWDRGLSPWVIVVPPPWCKGSAKSVSETLTDRAVHDLLEALVEELRAREIPSQFEKMDVVEEKGAVRVTISSRRRLRSLVVQVNGEIMQTWAETELVADKDSTPEIFDYARSVRVDAKPGAYVRVTAEDETGGREVRTLKLGGVR